MDWGTLPVDLLKLALASILGAVLGLERETHGRYAGLRTNLMVCLGSCLLMMVSLHMEATFRHLGMESSVRVDPGRVASYAIAGMGFIGAGVILKGRSSARGVTTAATLWTLCGVGLAVGLGYYLPALVTIVLAFFSLHGLRRLSIVRNEYSTLSLVFSGFHRPLDEIRSALLFFKGVKIQAINYDLDLKNKLVTYHVHLRNQSDLDTCKVADGLLELEGLEKVSWDRGVVP